jgi:hypothetical protein
MALWGKADSIHSPGTVTVDYAAKTVTGSGTTFTDASVGSVITIGVGATFGQAVISGITSDTFISIATTQYLSGAAIAGVAYTMSEKPVYTLEDSNYDLDSSLPYNAIYGVDEVEAQSNINTQYKVAHAGWVGIHTYNDMHGRLRVKSETLVAMSGITTGTATFGSFGDAADDAVFPDRLITITTQPSSLVGVASTAPQSFTVVASATPSATLSYQWQESTDGGTTFSNLSDGGIYSNVTTATVGIASTTTGVPDGNYYRVTITADGGASATSNAALLDYA